ncbi:MAG: four helix bundle protein [Candidatus Omnitrophica bacterium]|nr:four helix bundle protein [Candidatus Omnitrophota bacterium]
MSVCNNIAEGSRKTSGGRIQFYNYALDSARECIPMVELAYKLKSISEEKRIELRTTTIRISEMLFKLISSVERK